jgi:uncharacterized protein YdeI (YjbR/CyaY-like superfamily)
LNKSAYHADNNSLPPDLEKALSKNNAARRNLMHFLQVIPRRFLFRLDSTKQSATTQQRIKQAFLMAKANKKPGLKGFTL